MTIFFANFLVAVNSHTFKIYPETTNGSLIQHGIPADIGQALTIDIISYTKLKSCSFSLRKMDNMSTHVDKFENIEYPASTESTEKYGDWIRDWIRLETGVTSCKLTIFAIKPSDYIQYRCALQDTQRGSYRFEYFKLFPGESGLNIPNEIGFRPRNPNHPLTAVNVIKLEDNTTVVEALVESLPWPSPHQIKWHIGGINLSAGEQTKDGKCIAGNIEHLGSDLLKVSLMIISIKQTNLDLPSFLSIFNIFSEEELLFPFSVRDLVSVEDSETDNNLAILGILFCTFLVVVGIVTAVFFMRRRNMLCYIDRNNDAEFRMESRNNQNLAMYPLLQSDSIRRRTYPLKRSDRLRQRTLNIPDNDIGLINKTTNPINFDAFIASQQGIDSKKSLSNYALLEVSQVLGISVTVPAINFLAFTLEIRKAVAKINLGVAALRQSPRKAAIELFDEALNFIITNSNSDANAKLTDVIRYATEAIGIEDEFVYKISSSQLLLFSQFLCAMYDSENKLFLPLKKLSADVKARCVLNIEQRLNKLASEVGNKRTNKGKENQNLLENFLKAVYPVMSVCRGSTMPSQILSELPNFTILPAYLPHGEFNATTLSLGLHTREGRLETDYREFLVFLWKEETHVGKVVNDIVWMRLGQRVFQVPNTNSEEMILHLEEDSKKKRFFKCYYSTQENTEKMPCNHKNTLPTGMKPMKALLAVVSTRRDETRTREHLVKMNKLRKIYLKEIDIDIDEVNKNGDNLLYLVARLGNIENLKTLLDTGVDISKGKEPAFLRIAAGTENNKQLAILQELKEWHKDSKSLNAVDNEVNKQTALHKAVISKNKLFLNELIGELDLFAEDRDGKKPEDYGTPEIRRLIKDMKQARGFQ